MLCGDEVEAAVIDMGSSLTKVGTAGQDIPRFVFKSDVGLNKRFSEVDLSHGSKFIIGESALKSYSLRNHEFIDLCNPFWESKSFNMTPSI